MKRLGRRRRRDAYKVLVGAVVRYEGRLWTVKAAEFTSLALVDLDHLNVQYVHVADLGAAGRG